MRVDDPAVLEAARKLGWSGVRPLQAQVLEPILQGRDVIAVLPTSAGKSGIYQIPALARPGLVVVISPLVALMRDQVSRLERMGIPAIALNSHMSVAEKRRGVEQVRSGSIQVLYISPEKMLIMDTSILSTANVQMYAIDEAHCITEWGHDFRPSYYKIGRMLLERGFPKAQRVALTATATPQVMLEMAQVLQMDAQHAAHIRVSSDRVNIAYGVAGRGVHVAAMVERGGLPSIVYGSTRKGVEYATEQLLRSGYRAGCYHAGMTGTDRTRIQTQFEKGDLDVIVATCAFGMGIDHPHIRSVVHLEMPTSLEAYSQETGRAGRDGEPSKAIVRHTTETLGIALQSVDREWPRPSRVRDFWRHLAYMFEHDRHVWHGEGRIQLSNEEIADKISWDKVEVAACIRLLVDAGHLGWTPYHERPVCVDLLSGASLLKGSKQRRVISLLEQHADVHGHVEGTVGFFSEVIGMNYDFASQLRDRGALRVRWVDGSGDDKVEGRRSREQVLERLSSAEMASIDEHKILTIRERSTDRIHKAIGFLKTSGCRRQYLLEYFGDTSTRPPTDICCDHCVRAGR